MKLSKAKNVGFILLLFIALFYGIMIGKYRVFPYEMFKNFQDLTEEQVSNPLENVVYTDEDLQKLLSVSLTTLDSLRLQMTYKIFGSNSLPTALPDTIFQVRDKAFSDLDNLREIERFEITQKHNVKSIGYIFHPKNANHRLMLYHQGHSGGFINGKKTIAYFVKKGYTIYAFAMPLKGKNNMPVIQIRKLGKIHLQNHEELKFLEKPLQYFIDPVITMLNYGQQYNYDDISMVGISGGGWTTTLVAAMDSRVNYSFPVAGSSPQFIRYQKPSKIYGDFEQTYVDLYQSVNYLDMYVMGAVGKNRFQLQILNKYDPCCFYGEEFKKYEGFVSSNVGKFANGKFWVFSDTSHKEHKISELALVQIDKALNSIPQ